MPLDQLFKVQRKQLASNGHFQLVERVLYPRHERMPETKGYALKRWEEKGDTQDKKTGKRDKLYASCGCDHGLLRSR